MGKIVDAARTADFITNMDDRRLGTLIELAEAIP
jgi:hypothetical protein